MDRRVVRPPLEAEVEEEFSHHVEMRVRELVSCGWEEDAARAEALRRFGDMERLKSDCRQAGTRRDVVMNRRLWRDELRQDLAYALRQLRRAPGFAAITVLTLGVAIGANTSVFSVVDAVLLEPIPYPDSERLVAVWSRYLPPSGFDLPKFPLSGPEFLDYQEATEALESVAAFRTTSATVTGDGLDAERIRVGLYSASLPATLGVQPHLGRWFTPDEDVADGPSVVVLSYDVWASRYGSDPTIVGRTIPMDGTPTEVGGVAPRGFEFPEGTRAWMPLGLDRATEGGRAGHGTYAIGRLAHDKSMADLDAELAVLRDRWAVEFEHNVAHFLWAQDLHTEIVADAPQRLLLLMSAVSLVLLVACANIANLLLARGERRHGEVALRTTLGAGRGRITRQLATESLVLAGIAAGLGIALAFVGVRALIAIDPEALPRLDEVGIDGSVLLFTLLIAGLTALLFGVLPAYVIGRRATASLASSASRAVGGSRPAALRRLLVTGEVALSLVVVILAGLILRSFSALTSTDPRMDPENLLTFSISMPSTIYPDADGVPDEFERLLESVRSIPGVASATAATFLPFGGRTQWDFQLDDRPPRAEGEMAWNAGITHVSSDYFETMGIPVLEGRSFTAADGPDGPLVVIVSETLAERYWPGQGVIGKRLGYEMQDTVPWMTIVGVVPDPVTGTLDAEPYPHLYVPQAQAGESTYFVPRALQVAVRGAVGVEGLVAAVRAEVAGFDSDLALYQLRAMEDVVVDSYSGQRLTKNLIAMFAIIALALAGLGIYGVISYSVSGRTREIGVRVALGAERTEITRMILVEGARPLLTGVAVGLAGAWLATRFVESMLFGVEPTDPVTFAGLTVALLTLGLGASWVPALRATRIAPTDALRDE